MELYSVICSLSFDGGEVYGGTGSIAMGRFNVKPDLVYAPLEAYVLKFP